MKLEVWQRVDELFQAAVELDPTRRAVFLDEACSADRLLRSEVESLLASDSLDWDFIEKPALESAAILLVDHAFRLQPGQRISHFEIVDLLGRGGMGEVYLARDEILNRMVALKLLPSEYTQDPDRLRRFRREAQTVSALNHPNILTVHELGDFDGHKYIATELIEGETLRERLRRGRLSIDEAITIAIQLATALAAAHRATVIHRDIKPENIMLRPDGLVKILDFGLAKLVEQPDLISQQDPAELVDISSHLLMGTPRYMSPEQVGGHGVDKRSDIFSLGAVLYEMLSGQPPFDEKDHGRLAASILKNDPVPLTERLDGVPVQLSVVVGKMLSKEKQDRYQDADELLADLKLFKEEFNSDAANSNYARQGAPQRWPSSKFVLLIVFVCVSAIGFASYRFLLSQASGSESGWVSKASISSPRLQAEPVVMDGVLYVTGGWNLCTPFASLEAYDPATNAWTQRAPMLTARGAHGVAALDGRLYAVGGFTECGNPTSSVEAYDPETDTWSTKTSLPQPRSGHVVAAANGKLYAIGGMTAKGDQLDVNTEYDPERDTWTEVMPIPTARIGAAAVVVQDMIYVIGGANGSRALSTVEAYDPTTNSWLSRRPMLSAHNNLGAAELNGIIYAFGGVGDRTSVEAYDPMTDTWTFVTELPTYLSSAHAATFQGSIYLAGGFDGINYLSDVIAFTPPANAAFSTVECPTLHVVTKTPMLTARSGMAVGMIRGMIYVVGGYDGSSEFLAVNEAYDPSTNSWTKRAAMPTARETRASNTAVVGDRLYVIGGNVGGKCTDLNQVYDPLTDAWSTMAPLPTPRCHLAVVANAGLIYAIGGTNTSGTIRYSVVEVYNPEKNAWSTAVPMPTPRMDPGAVSLNGEIYVMGGWNRELNPHGLTAVEAFDPVNNTWTQKGSMRTSRHGMAVGQLNGLIIIVGGQRGETTLLAVEVYDPAKDSWSTLRRIATSRTYSSATAFDDTLYVFGGIGSDVTGVLSTTEAYSLSPCSH